MGAEAQCAFLDSEGLTQGTITDDSDIWLFGGKKVFRNFFNQEKLVTSYTAAELVEHFGLNRERLVLLAMLTGSDYTMGIQDVGPVTALEVLAEFPGENLAPLNDFKAWWSRVIGEGLPVAVGNKTREMLMSAERSLAGLCQTWWPPETLPGSDLGSIASKLTSCSLLWCAPWLRRSRVRRVLIPTSPLGGLHCLKGAG